MTSQFSDEINSIVGLLNDFDQSKANPRGVMATDSVLRKIRMAYPDNTPITDNTKAIKSGITSLYMPAEDLDRDSVKTALKRLCDELKKLTT